MSAPRPPLEVLLERVLYAPIGLIAAWRDELPKLAARGRREVDLARLFGRFAVEQGKRELDKRLRPPAPTTRPSTAPVSPNSARSTTGRPAAPPAARRPAAGAPKRAPAGSSSRRRPPAVGSLAIAEYDSLAASQVVARLAALSPAELARIEAYEIAGRGRRTILGKIAQLRASA